MAENNDTPAPSVQVDAPIQVVKAPDNATVKGGYQVIERKGYQPPVTTSHAPPPQSVSGIIPLIWTTQPITSVPTPSAPAPAQQGNPAAPAQPGVAGGFEGVAEGFEGVAGRFGQHGVAGRFEGVAEGFGQHGVAGRFGQHGVAGRFGQHGVAEGFEGVAGRFGQQGNLVTPAQQDNTAAPTNVQKTGDQPA